jgi:hypothetical protein
MKMGKINGILEIILKIVVILCIITITFTYWSKRNTGKYVGTKELTLYILNTQTGEPDLSNTR